MKDGYIKVAAVTPKITVADPAANAEEIMSKVKEAYEAGARIIVCPELCITGTTCGDLFFQDTLLDSAKEALLQIADDAGGYDALLFVGLPLEKDHALYNVVAAIYDGEIVGLIPKTALTAKEARWFAPGNEDPCDFFLEEACIPFGMNIIFEAGCMKGLMVACEIGEELCSMDAPSVAHAIYGATLIVNPSAMPRLIGEKEKRKAMALATSMKLTAGYISVNGCCGESSTDFVYGGNSVVTENGVLLSEKSDYADGILYADVDMQLIAHERRMRAEHYDCEDASYYYIDIMPEAEDTVLTRQFTQSPFMPEGDCDKDAYCRDILDLQAQALKKRFAHTGCKKAVIGISGGLDSTLALIATALSFDLMGIDRKNIIAITMPCFGTSDRTHDNACKMVNALGLTFEEVDIQAAVRQHFSDIKQDESNHNVTYENAQARERTQILMDIANREGALVIGTGDLSELALGWATYNGDHMSNYGINGGIPKTVIRHVVRYFGEQCGNEELKETLFDVLDTPVSPELLPPSEGEISQKTEDLVGPYELHDFFIYYMMRYGFAPKKIERIAKLAFAGTFDDETITKWLKNYYKRFFAQQFKRSCLADGPAIFDVGVSPRGGLVMPSDASMKMWMKELED